MLCSFKTGIEKIRRLKDYYHIDKEFPFTCLLLFIYGLGIFGNQTQGRTKDQSLNLCRYLNLVQ